MAARRAQRRAVGRGRTDHRRRHAARLPELRLGRRRLGLHRIDRAVPALGDRPPDGDLHAGSGPGGRCGRAGAQPAGAAGQRRAGRGRGQLGHRDRPDAGQRWQRHRHRHRAAYGGPEHHQAAHRQRGDRIEPRLQPAGAQRRAVRRRPGAGDRSAADRAELRRGERHRLDLRGSRRRADLRPGRHPGGRGRRARGHADRGGRRSGVPDGDQHRRGVLHRSRTARHRNGIRRRGGYPAGPAAADQDPPGRVAGRLRRAVPVRP